MSIATIAVVPTVAGGALLQEGSCGARVPSLDDYGDPPTSGRWTRWMPHTVGWGGPPVALVLAYNGAPVHSGMAQALRVLTTGPWQSANGVHATSCSGIDIDGSYVALRLVVSGDGDIVGYKIRGWGTASLPNGLNTAYITALVLVHEGLASRIVLLDEHGMEVLDGSASPSETP